MGFDAVGGCHPYMVTFRRLPSFIFFAKQGRGPSIEPVE